MTPLSDALTTAQRSALASLGKAYIAGKIEADDVYEALHGCGISDDIDISFLTHTWDVLKEWGASPSENGKAERVETELMTKPQRGFIEQLCREKNLPEPDDFDLMTKAEAHETINALQEGSYDPAKTRVPF